MTFKVITGDCMDVLASMNDASIDAVITDPPAGIAFMGKDWDKDKGGRDNWIAYMELRFKEIFRVLKPGGHALVWALPRTSHWTGFAVENAGFEIRDRHSHFFGTGFPKSSNIAKQIDKSLGVEPTVVGSAKPTSPEAKEWEGWGTALKPACEDWWLCRKPFKGAAYRNVMKNSTGALNIDACRIPTEEKLTRKLGKTTESDSGWKSVNRSEIAGKDGGRWPAHISFDAEAAEVLDEQSGILKSGKIEPHHTIRHSKNDSMTGDNYANRSRVSHADSGGASRFYYIAKPSKKEKNAGTTKNTHPTVKSVSLMRWLVRLITPPGGVVLDPFCGSGSTGVACVEEGFEFVGIEQSSEYVKIAEDRISNAEKK